MQHYTRVYRLRKDDEELVFQSEKEAGQYLGVARCTVASCYRNNSKCKGYIVERGEITTHHSTKTRLYKIWDGMKGRCERNKHKHYKNYGGRGISVCKEWETFSAFKEWAIANGYNDTLTIDRKDCNGNYEPGNCRWVTMKEQANNKRNNHRIAIGDHVITLSECAEKYSIPKSTIRWREEHSRNIITGAKMDGGTSDGEDA